MPLKSFAALFIALPGLLFAGVDPILDNSHADVDGPYVWFRGKHITVKRIERKDTSFVATERSYDARDKVILDCQLPAIGEHFTFSLHDSMSIPASTYPQPDKMLAISDIEGNFEAFRALLLGAQVIDKQYNWIFGAGHLVLDGDFFDRGLNVTECLWLVYKLEKEAQQAGGMVHFILGNHELLNLQGNAQYVRNKYLDNAALMGLEYADLYAHDTELGRWLRSKNAVERIGDYVFCHGGISPELAASGMSLQEINDIGRLYYGVPSKFISEAKASLIFDQQKGIFWYRGMARNKLTHEDLGPIMAFSGGNHIVIGHTMAPEVTPLYDGQVICIDLYHDENLRTNTVNSLYVEKGMPFSLDAYGVKTSIYSVQVTSGGK